jgi:hypothetical protein
MENGGIGRGPGHSSPCMPALSRRKIPKELKSAMEFRSYQWLSIALKMQLLVFAVWECVTL